LPTLALCVANLKSADGISWTECASVDIALAIGRNVQMVENVKQLRRDMPMITDELTFKDIAKACMPTASERPDCYYRLIERLIRDGFTYNHKETEWSNGEIKGRLCTMTKKGDVVAWLRHHNNDISHLTV